MTLRAEVAVTLDRFVLEAHLEAPAGRTVALLGPNGAGKTTIVRALAGLRPLDAGRIELEGAVLDDSRTGRHVSASRRSIGLVPQDLLLFPNLSALDNAAYPLHARGIRRALARERAVALLGRLGLHGRHDARPTELSGGERQRVALARALIHEPRLLLLDEPLSALDAEARPSVRALLRSALAEFGGARILVTHDPVEAMTLGDDLVIVEEGRVTQTGSPDEIRAAPRTPYAAALIGVNLFRGRLEPLERGVARLRTADGEVVVSWAGERPVDDVVALLRPGDVSLSRSKPEGSQRNVLRGEISSVTVEPDRARIRVASRPALLAEVTLGSLTRLELTEGAEVWASFKAMEVELIVP